MMIPSVRLAVLVGSFALVSGCGGAPSAPTAPETPAAPEAPEAPAADDVPVEAPDAPAAAGDDAGEVCGEVARRAAECNVKLIPPAELSDPDKVKADMATEYTQQCTERTADDTARLASARACLDQADDCALVECLGDTIGR